VLVLNFEDWDLADPEKFLHLATTQLIRQKVDMSAGMIELEPRKQLIGVEKSRLLNLLRASHDISVGDLLGARSPKGSFGS